MHVFVVDDDDSVAAGGHRSGRRSVVDAFRHFLELMRGQRPGAGGIVMGPPPRCACASMA